MTVRLARDRNGRHLVQVRRRRVAGLRALAVPLVLAGVVGAAAPSWIRVAPGDTLWGLARAHHTQVSTIERLNHLAGSLILIGQLLELPGPATPRAVGDRGAPVARDRTYVVRSGDALSVLCARFDVPMAEVAALNHLPADLQIDVGQVLRLPPPVRASRHGPARPTWSPAPTIRLIRAEARALAVPAPLALAVADEESGFNQAETSPTGAIGVMQLEPATAAWLSGVVLRRRLDPHRVVANVIMGLAFLHLLLRTAPLPDAIAGYYQGLGSVDLHGWLPPTRTYVADVLALRARFTG